MQYSKIILGISLCFLILSSNIITAQNNTIKREDTYSLLWKVEGDSLKKPSYIFGTMHVRNKKAFSFSDSVLVKLLNVDIFASEINIDTMNYVEIQKSLDKAEDKYFFEEDFSGIEIDQLRTNLSNNDGNIDIKPFKKKSYKELKDYFENFESIKEELMPTYVDDYLFQTAKDNGIKVMGMETIKFTEELIDTISKEFQKQFIKNKFDSIGYFINSKEQMLNIYHSGDINSMLKFFNNNPYYLNKIILDNRNVKMVDTMENIMKNNSVFIAAGAAHLPGDSGLIQIFRDRGYTVTKVNATFTGIGDSIIESLSNKITSWYTHVDSSKYYSLELPKEPAGHDFLGGLFRMYICNNTMKNSAYFFYAIPKVLSGLEKEEEIATHIKETLGTHESLEIISTKKISLNGINGYEFILKNTEFFKAKARVYLNKEYMYFQMVGNDEETYNSDDANKFFNSFKVFDVEQKNENIADNDTWKKYSYKDGAFSVRFPNKPNYLKKDIPSFDFFNNSYSLHMYTSINSKDKEVYIVRWNDLPEGYFYDNYKDIYQETFVAIFEDEDYEFIEENEIKIGTESLQGFETTETLKDKSFEIRIRTYVRGNRVYLLLGQQLIGNKNSNVDMFFNSFEGIPYTNTIYENHNVDGINIDLPREPLLTDSTSNESLWYSSYIPYKTFSSTDPNNGLMISVNVNSFPKYYYAQNADSILKDNETENLYLYETSNIKTGVDKNGIHFRSGMITDEKSPNKILYKFYLNGNKSYQVFCYINEELIQDSIKNKIFNSISFDEPDTTINIFKKKTRLILSDLKSNDTLVFKAAKQALDYYEFDSTDIQLLYEAMEYSYPDSTEEWGRVKDNIISAIKDNHDKEAINVLKNAFNNSYGLKYDILIAITAIDSNQNDLVYNLLLEVPDSNLSTYKLNRIYSYLADSSLFFKNKINNFINISDKSFHKRALIDVINNNYNEFELDTIQLSIISNLCIEMFNLSYDSLLNCKKDSYNKYKFIYNIESALQFFTLNNSFKYDDYFKKSKKLNENIINSKICLYNLDRNNKTNSSIIKQVINDPTNGWDFLKEVSDINKLSIIDNKILEEDNLALMYLKSMFYWEDFYPENFKLIDIRDNKECDKGYKFYIFTFEEFDETYVAIVNGIKKEDGKILYENANYDYSYEINYSEEDKEKIIADLISRIQVIEDIESNN